MMRYSFAIVALICITFYASCTKDQTSIPILTACDLTDTTGNSYNLRIKQILDGNCTLFGCHDGIFEFTMLTYQTAKTAFETRPAICAIKHEGGCLPMPKDEPQLADSLIKRLECWKDSGFPE